MPPIFTPDYTILVLDVETVEVTGVALTNVPREEADLTMVVVQRQSQSQSLPDHAMIHWVPVLRTK